MELLEELLELELETIQFTTLVNDKAALFETQALTLTVGLAQQEHDAPKSSKFALQEATDTWESVTVAQVEPRHTSAVLIAPFL